MEDFGPVIKLDKGIVRRCDACGVAIRTGSSSSSRRWVTTSLRGMLLGSDTLRLHL